MESFFARLFRPVKRQGAERYLRLTLLAFAVSVVLTRLLLWLSGYPKVGSGPYHIAHLLWGGLLLFVAALLPLTIANRWVYTAGGVLGGLGVGLFIDEVGKFITSNNDYFFPAAAPIIYAFFLLTTLVYLRVSRPPSGDSRAELYRIFDDMSEVLDHDLDPQEQADLEARLKLVAQRQDPPEFARLAEVLLNFVHSNAALVERPVPGPIHRFLARVEALENRFFDRQRFKTMIIVALALFAAFSLWQVGVLLADVTAPAVVSPEARVAAGLAPAGTPGTAGVLPEALESGGEPQRGGSAVRTGPEPSGQHSAQPGGLLAAFWSGSDCDVPAVHLRLFPGPPERPARDQYRRLRAADCHDDAEPADLLL